MRAFLLTAKLCTTNWRSFVSWMAVGPLLCVFYGVGSGPNTARGWAILLVIGLLLGAFIGALVVVNDCREKKNKSLTKLDREIRELTERELNLVFMVVGAVVGMSAAHALDAPPAGYLIGAVLIGLLGLARRKILQIIP
jgi:hypothetical protein